MKQIPIRGFKGQKITALGLGMFDGMHLGHAEILKRSSHLLTFDPHPALHLGKKPTLKRLTTLRELRHFAPSLLVLPFGEHVASLHPAQFLDQVILNVLHPEEIVVGYDFRFGQKKSGDVAFIREWARDHQIRVTEVPPYSINDKIVKSSAIREDMCADRFADAVRLMGHPYLMIGSVVAGQGLGRQIGFPTANLKLPTDKLMPCSGVYSGTVAVDKTVYSAMIYVGRKPTFETAHPVAVEVYIHRFSGNLYGRNLNVMIRQKIRGEQKFPSKDALIEQIHRDVAAAGLD